MPVEILQIKNLGIVGLSYMSRTFCLLIKNTWAIQGWFHSFSFVHSSKRYSCDVIHYPLLNSPHNHLISFLKIFNRPRL